MSDATVAPLAEAGDATHARKSNFFLAMRILPKPQRHGMYEVYSFCRLVDDIADEGGPRPARHAALDRWRADIDAICAGQPAPRQLDGLATAVRAFGLRRQDFHAVIDGMAMDVEQDIRAPDWATLDLYCDRVASAVGRLSVRIFGTPQPDGDRLAHHLGRALQLTNILRDIDEDAAIGRLYLPREALRDAGIETTDPREVAADPRLPQACGAVVDRAREHFRQARVTMARCPRRTVRAPRIMDAAYGAIFERTAERGFALPRQRIGASKPALLLSVLRYGLF